MPFETLGENPESLICGLWEPAWQLALDQEFYWQTLDGPGDCGEDIPSALTDT